MDSDRRFDIWCRLLFVVCCLLIAMGLWMVFFPLLGLVTPTKDPFVSTLWAGGPGPSPESARFYRWALGVWGGTLAGWALVLAYIVRHPFRRRERWAWRAVAAGVALWFPLDTFVSLYFKIYLNAALNGALLLLIAIPLWATKKRFSAER